MTFTWVEKILDIIVDLMDLNEEYDNVYSYLPYAVCFGAVSQNAYAASKKPYFTIFCHVVGSPMGNSRSINSYYTGES